MTDKSLIRYNNDNAAYFAPKNTKRVTKKRCYDENSSSDADNFDTDTHLTLNARLSHAKNRKIEISPSRCIMTNDLCAEFAHIKGKKESRENDDEKLDIYNTIWLSPTMHTKYDTWKFGIAPDKTVHVFDVHDEILMKYHNMDLSQYIPDESVPYLHFKFDQAIEKNL